MWLDMEDFLQILFDMLYYYVNWIDSTKPADIRH